jgi:hypothetical protein
VIDGACTLEAYARELVPMLRRLPGGDVLRTQGVFLERFGRALLIEALAVERGRKTGFYVRLASHEDGRCSVRVDPATQVERTDGVKRIVAEVGADLLARSPGATVRVTNLVLPSPPAGAAGRPADP